MTGVVITPHCTSWPELFRTLRVELLGACAPLQVMVEHIGSTAVPGLVAKPVIDVLLGAAALADVELRITALDALGYTYVSKYEVELPMRRYFVKSAAGSLRVHVHAVVIGSAIWRNHLAFRDALRADARLRTQYQALKLHLAESHADDKAAYTAAKEPFIRAVLAATSHVGTVGER